MTENRGSVHHGNAFVWGLIIGAVLATLLTTKKGRTILKNFSELALELMEDFVEERVVNKAPVTPKAEKEIKEDLASGITEDETPQETSTQDIPQESAESVAHEEPEETKSNGNGYKKKRLFRGVKRK